MPAIRLALAQVNPTVGDLTGNVELARRWVAAAAAEGANLIALPEMVIPGYPVEDLAIRPSFAAASQHAIAQLAELLLADGYGELVVVAGYLRPGGFNSAAVLHRGSVVASYDKHHLPNYGVFDERRNFASGDKSVVIRAFGVDIALAICEDIWQEGGPVAAVSQNQAGLLLVINGSPYEHEKDDVRLALVQRRASEAGCTLAYVNMTGGQDELVFEGDSIVVDSEGQVLARAPQFTEHLLVCDLELPACGTHTQLPSGEPVIDLNTRGVVSQDRKQAAIAPRMDREEEIYTALVLALRDYLKKSGFASVVLGLSGGIDSALVAAIACDAIGAKQVHGVALPSRYSSAHSLEDAQLTAQRTGLHLRVQPIEPLVQAFLGELHLTGLAEENVQARVRGTTLMGISNQEGHLVLATGNKSELAVGYSTLYGDAVGGFAPIKDVFKIDVWKLAKWRNTRAAERGEPAPIPENSIAKPPSAELRPGQLDSDSLPDYPILDAILHKYIEQDASFADLVAAGFSADVVSRVIELTDRAEYKRRQYPPGPKVSRRAFGRDRRLPIVSHWRE